MANFKASSSSSRFVIGTTVLLLLVVINIYGAPVATACSSSSKVMLFNSSSLEVVEQVAKDQGITEFAIDDHEIQRRVLQGRLPGAGSLTRALTDLIDTFKPAKATAEDTRQLKQYFNKYCTMSCSSSGNSEGYCACSNRDSKNLARSVGVSSSCGPYTVYYCCNGENCSLCCESRLEKINPGFTTPSASSGAGFTTPSASSGSPIAYVVMTVIAIFTTISYMFFF